MKQFAGDVILHMCSKSHDHVMYASWDTEWDRQNFLMFFASCCPFTTLTPHPSPLMIPEKQSLEQKRKKCLEILSFYTYMYAINEHHDIWFLKCKVWLTQIFVILCNFLPFQSHNSSENQALGDIIILHICPINDNHLMYGSWDMTERIFCYFGSFFCPFTPLTTWKIKI